VETEELKILLALESVWTVSVNGENFVSLPSSEIRLEDTTIHLGRLARKLVGIQWLRPNVIRIQARQRFRSKPDVLTFFPGERLPGSVDLQRRRRGFQREIAKALSVYFQTTAIQKITMYTDRRFGISGAYARFVMAKRAVIAVDPDESSTVIDGIMRAALLWRPLIRRRIAVIIPRGRHHAIASRLRAMPDVRSMFEWLEWDDASIRPLQLETEARDTHVQSYRPVAISTEVARICAYAPDLLRPMPHISGNAVAIRLRGIEVARVTETGTIYPLGEPLDEVVRHLELVRRHGSNHPLARAHEERWLESNLIGAIRDVLPAVDDRHIYPQVPSFIGRERNILDLLAITKTGRLVVIEIKVSADPDLPFQALDYWIAVERHRRAGDFQQKGYFQGCSLQDKPAVLVLVAPLLAFHKTLRYLVSVFPSDIPLIEIGINQAWKRDIKVLRRRGLVS
jgi:hypothetical protein